MRNCPQDVQPIIVVVYKISHYGAQRAECDTDQPDKKESRAKALLQCVHKVPVISDCYFFGVAANFSRRRFSSHRLGPQPPERNILAQTRSIQRIYYSYRTPVHFVTMVVVHCTINHQAGRFVPVPHDFSGAGRLFDRLPRL
jgi:hypothetical protein